MSVLFLRIAGVFFALAGAFTLTAAARIYRKCVRLMRDNSYRMKKHNLRRQLVSEYLMYLFAGSYLVGAVQALTAVLNELFLFETVMFLACAMFFYFMVCEQLDTEKELYLRKLEILRTFVNAIDSKDSYTRGHSQQVVEIVKLIYEQLPPEISSKLCLPKLLDAALLHDVGKIDIADSILKKNGPLTDEEWVQMRSHPKEGKRLLKETCFVQISDWVLYHHEHMDGSGYEGLPADEIPIESRLISIADTFSALTTKRGYRDAMGYEQAIDIMKGISGTQIDSELFSYFLLIPNQKFDTLYKIQ